MKRFLHDGHQQIGADGCPDLGFHCVERGAIESFDSQVLFDPFEKQFHLPARFVQLSNRPGIELEIVGKKDEGVLFVGIDECDASHRFGILL